jgi:hypothetical protein
LSPPVRRITDRHGSKTNRRRIIVCRGRSSFRFAIFEPVRVSTKGSAQRRTVLREHVDSGLHLMGRLRISVTQVLHPPGDLIGLVDLPLTHPINYSKRYSHGPICRCS